MDNITIERRSSLNATQLSTCPIAESTCVNLNGRRAGAHFQWGGTPISPKYLNNSSGCLANERDNSPTNVEATMNNRSMGSPEPNKANLSKIDPRIYADVQSKGLASRIVKYHENGTRLSRSMSMNNLYNRPGQFPVVNLKNTELPYKAIKQPMSMTRIAPPEKSMFHANTLSSLLRSNSVLGLQKSDDQISHENRPILHPPPTESDLAPTRSVLDVLKEISRKRINSDDLDAADATKKYCYRDIMVNSYDLQQQHQHHIRNTNIALSYKRQREQLACGSDALPQSLMPNQLSSVTPFTSRIDPSLQKSPQRSSPEHLAKKRLCSYNNDITSSLSSSVYQANKRKFYKQQGPNISKRSPPAEYELHKAKMQRQHAELRLTKTLSGNTIPITPIPDTPVGQVDDLLTSRTTTMAAVPARLPVISVPVHRIVTEPIRPVKDTASVAQFGQTLNAARTNKPKLTLFNKKYDEKAEQTRLANEGRPASPQDECAGIQFVKPKKISSISGIKNPLIERTQKSKLALMLCGLRGELYQSDNVEDVVDDASKSGPPDETQQVTATLAKTIGTNATTGQRVMDNQTILTNTTITTTTTTATTNAGYHSTNSQPTLAPTTAAAASTSSATTTTQAATTATVPMLGGFKFTPPTNTSVGKSATALPTSSTNTTIQKTSSLVGLKLTPQTTSAFPASNTAPTFTLGTPATAVTTTIATVAPLPVLGGFSFSPAGNTKPTTLNTVAAINAAPPAFTATAAFGFGANTSTATTVATTAAPAMFGTPIKPVDAANKVTAAATTPSFKFGTSNSNTTANTIPAVAVAAFGSNAAISAITKNTIATNNTIATTTNKSIATTTTNNSIATTTANDTTATTSTTNNTTATATTTNNIFTTNTSSATSTMSFGNFNNSASNASKAFTFGTAATLDAKTSAADANKPPTFGVSTNTNVFGDISQSSAFAAPNTGKSFTFGGASATSAASNATATTGPIGASSVNAQTNNLFNASPHKPAATAASFPLNAASTKPQDVVTVVPNSFGFGSGANNPPTTNNKSFPFTTIVTSANPATSASTAANSFGFGSAASANPTLSFGGGNTTQPTNSAGSRGFLFGSAAAGADIAPQTAQTSIFGGGGDNDAATTNSSLFAFGGTTADKPASGGFSFGAHNSQTSAKANPVAAGGRLFPKAAIAAVNNTNNNTTTTGIVKPSFNFGGPGTTLANANDNVGSGKSLFGNVGASANAAGNTFGAVAAVSNPNQNNTFTFGSNNSSAPQSMGGNLFGGATDNNKPANSGFSFVTPAVGNSQSMQQSKPTAVAAPSPSTAAFSFGGATTNTANTNGPTPFAFGSNGGGVNVAANANKPFAFGGNTTVPATANTNASNIFGKGAMPQNLTGQTSTANFNFSANANTPINNAGPGVAANMFAPPPTDRPIRRATRRLQKS